MCIRDRYCILLTLFGFVASPAFTQIKIAQYNSGLETVSYEVLENDYKQMNKLNVQINLAHVHEFHSFFTLNYIQPKFGMLRSHWGIGYLGFEGTIFLPTKDFEDSYAFQLRAKATGVNERTIYAVEEKIIRKKPFGIRIGYALKDYSKSIVHQNFRNRLKN